MLDYSLVDQGNVVVSTVMDSKVGHKCETQSDSQKVKNTFRRNGIYYYKRRIPKDIVGLGAFGFKKGTKEPLEFIKYSLKTSDPKVARERVDIANYEAAIKFEKLRQGVEKKCEEQEPDKVEVRTRKFESLSVIERKDYIFRLFVELERATVEAKGRQPNAYDDDELLERLEVIGTDLAVLDGTDKSHSTDADWTNILIKKLKTKGVLVSDIQSPAFQEMADSLRRAYTENTWRSFEALQGRPSQVRDSLFKTLTAFSEVETPQKESGRTISEVCEAYIDARYKKTKASTHGKHKQYAGILIDYFGANTPVTAVKMEQAKGLVEFLSSIPVNAAKVYPKLSLLEASKCEAKKESPKFFSPKSQRQAFIGIKAIFDFVVDLEWLDRNPFAKKTFSQLLPEKEKKNPIFPNTEDFNNLFKSQKFLSERHNGLRGEPRFWLPLLCMYHGFRANEACQLFLSDIKSEGGIYYVEVSEDEGSKQKSLKTKESNRRVPLHKEVISIGFLDFVTQQKKMGYKELFAGLKTNSRGSKADGVCSWFGRFKGTVFTGDMSQRGAKGIHSLRHAFTRACRDAGITEDIRRALGGWTDGDSSSETDYGGGFSMGTLKEAIDKVQYEGLDLSHLYIQS